MDQSLCNSFYSSSEENFKVGSGSSGIPTRNIVNPAPSKETRLRLHTTQNLSQVMVIRISPPSPSGLGTDTVSFCLLFFNKSVQFAPKKLNLGSFEEIR